MITYLMNQSTLTISRFRKKFEPKGRWQQSDEAAQSSISWSHDLRVVSPPRIPVMNEQIKSSSSLHQSYFPAILPDVKSLMSYANLIVGIDLNYFKMSSIVSACYLRTYELNHNSSNWPHKAKCIPHKDEFLKSCAIAADTRPLN